MSLVCPGCAWNIPWTNVVICAITKETFPRPYFTPFKISLNNPLNCASEVDNEVVLLTDTICSRSIKGHKIQMQNVMVESRNS